jgi:hypothetical protein
MPIFLDSKKSFFLITDYDITINCKTNILKSKLSKKVNINDFNFEKDISKKGKTLLIESPLDGDIVVIYRCEIKNDEKNDQVIQFMIKSNNDFFAISEKITCPSDTTLSINF